MIAAAKKKRMCLFFLIVVIFLLSYIKKEDSYETTSIVEFQLNNYKLSEEQEKRLQHVQETCKDWNLRHSQNNTINPKDFFFNIVDDKHKIILCEVPLVACANWKRVMLVLSGKLNVTHVDQLRSAKVHDNDLGGKYLTRMSTYSPEQIRYRIKHYFSFMFVRNPLERLLSAYLKKFTVPTVTDYQMRLGRNIVKLFRENPSLESLKHGHDVTFAEFIEYIVNVEKLEKGRIDRHWMTYMDLCNPCAIDYNFIGKYETFSSDVEDVLSAAGVDGIVSFPETTHRKVQPKTSTLLQEYMSNISEENVKKVCNQFDIDFTLFNYTCSS